MIRYDLIYDRLANRAIGHAMIDIETFLGQLIDAGVPSSQAEALLLQDLEDSGPIFGKFFRSLGAAAESSAIGALRQGENIGNAINFDEEFAAVERRNQIEDIIDGADPEELQAIEENIKSDNLTWVAELVNTCERCLPLHGVTLTKDEWESRGLHPNTIHEGWTSSCHCDLIPETLIDGIAGGREAIMAPLVRIRTKTVTGLVVSKRTVRAVGQKDIERAMEAQKKASYSLIGRRTLRQAGKANAE